MTNKKGTVVKIMKRHEDHFRAACAIFGVQPLIYTVETNAEILQVDISDLNPEEVWCLSYEYQLRIREEELKVAQKAADVLDGFRNIFNP